MSLALRTRGGCMFPPGVPKAWASSFGGKWEEVMECTFFPDVRNNGDTPIMLLHQKLQHTMTMAGCPARCRCILRGTRSVTVDPPFLLGKEFHTSLPMLPLKQWAAGFLLQRWVSCLPESTFMLISMRFSAFWTSEFPFEIAHAEGTHKMLKTLAHVHRNPII